MACQSWTQILARMPIGRLLKDGAYRVKSHDAKGITIERVATGSTVRITRKKVETTDARLEAGERLPKQSNKGVSYTVAVEFLVVACIGPASIELAADRHWQRPQ